MNDEQKLSIGGVLLLICLVVGGYFLGRTGARSEGAKAYKTGKTDAANPYQNYLLRSAWIDGWYEAKTSEDFGKSFKINKYGRHVPIPPR